MTAAGGRAQGLRNLAVVRCLELHQSSKGNIHMENGTKIVGLIALTLHFL